MFHQVEGLLIDETSSFGDLKGLLARFSSRVSLSEMILRFVFDPRIFHSPSPLPKWIFNV